jgi:hypothetical protein
MKDGRVVALVFKIWRRHQLPSVRFAFQGRDDGVYCTFFDILCLDILCQQLVLVFASCTSVSFFFVFCFHFFIAFYCMIEIMHHMNYFISFIGGVDLRSYCFLLFLLLVFAEIIMGAGAAAAD